MGEVKILPQLLTVFGLIIGAEKLRVDLIKGRWRMFELLQDWSALNVVEQVDLSVNPLSLMNTLLIRQHCFNLSSGRIGGKSLVARDGSGGSFVPKAV